MGIANLFRNQLSAVIQWQADKQQYLWYKYPTKTDEIKNASKLIVGPGQGAVLVYEGKVVDVLTEEGTFNLKTDNHPFFTTLVNLRQNFESEHKLHIYFYRKAQVTNQQWGTSSPVKFIDEQYNLPVEMGVNGTFSYQISDVEHFFKDIVGARTEVSNSEIRELILGRLSQNIVTTIHKLGYSYNQIDGHLTEIGQELATLLNEETQKLGFTLTDFRVDGTLFDEQTQERIGRIADVTADSQAAQAGGLTYAELEKLRALRDAARNEGGLSGSGVQMGVGLEMGKQMGAATQLMNERSTADDDLSRRLARLRLLRDENVITDADYEAKKRELLNEI
ncbi:SPFH domain-containing protein [Hoylesella loescheii]|uniref:SPFH domain-containing protein n=1 Tax=Hoylesella loescheii TaxID=840 RepID=UPI0028E4F9C4|nr:SPFH domain-containing protein [Hoylesella loescheii]